MSTQRLARWIGSTPLPDEQLGWKAHRNHISPTRQTPKRIRDPSPRASQPTARLHRSAHPSPATRRILPGRSERENVDSLKNSCREIKPDPDLTQRPRSPTNQGRLLGRFTLVAICLDDQSDSSARMSLPLLPPSFPFQKTQVDRSNKSGQPGKVSVGAQLHPPPHGRQADLLHSLPAHDSKSVRAFFQMQVRGTDAAVGDGSDPGGWNRTRRGGIQSHSSRQGRQCSQRRPPSMERGQRGMERTPSSSESMGMASLPCT